MAKKPRGARFGGLEMFDVFFWGGLSSVENPGWLFDIGDYTTQLWGL